MKVDINGLIHFLLKETNHWQNVVDFKYVEDKIEKYSDDPDFINLAQKDQWRLPTDFINSIIFHKFFKEDKEAYRKANIARKNGYLVTFDKELIDNVQNIANSSYPFLKWYKDKTIYVFSEGLKRTLGYQTKDFAINRFIPTYSLKNLPSKCFYVYLGNDFYVSDYMGGNLNEILADELPKEKRELFKNDFRFLGFFIINETEPLMKEHFLSIRATFFSDSANYGVSHIVFLYLPNGEKTTFYDANFRQLDGQSEGLNKNKISVLRRETYITAIQFILYLCSDNAEINQNKENLLYYRKPAAQYIKNKLREVAVYDVGTGIGKRIIESENRELNRLSQYKDIPRRAHWHHYWVGKRKSSERHLVLRWLLPTFVRYENLEYYQNGITTEDAPHDVKRILLSVSDEEVIADEEDDVKFINELEKATDFEEPTTALLYAEAPRPIPCFFVEGEKRKYKRDRIVAKNALKNADYRCEVDPSHSTFLRKKIDLPYTEPHHLIPMYYQSQFNVSLDVEQNIVSLCSNCHNQLHYGRENSALLIRLYQERCLLLQEAGIMITIDDLLEMYK